MAKGIGRRIHEFILSHTNRIWSLMVGKVTFVDRTNMRCKVQIKLRKDKSDVNVIVDVPVVYPRGGNSIIMMPIKKDDVVLIGFSKFALNHLIIDKTVVIDERHESQIQFKKTNAMILGGFVLTNEIGSTIFDTVDYKIPEDEIVIVSQGPLTLGKYIQLLNLGGDPASPQNGMIWRDGSGFHLYGDIECPKFKLTSLGGFAIKLTNKTGSDTVAGQLVRASTGTADAFETAVVSELHPIGVVLGVGISDGSEAWVVVSGIADVLMDSGGAALGDRLISSATPGSAAVNNSPSAAVHFQEIGHCVGARVGAGLVRGVLHFL